ncbi:uncharacterized protein PAC_10186 [Phialocephala subalpina]|uniref:Uncharacterized protein n=1 Tax=Phialocephala subalpina TaxID=576137 RepID=A0A1L7X5I4_9HELO|nr:uncharacterized protein PAC_10186 [Phialocephala subalpina]
MPIVKRPPPHDSSPPSYEPKKRRRTNDVRDTPPEVWIQMIHNRDRERQFESIRTDMRVKRQGCRIRELETQVEERNDCLAGVEEEHMSIVDSIVESGMVDVFARQIRGDVAQTYEEIIEEPENPWDEHPSMRELSDRADETMMEYIPKLYQLSKMRGGLDLALGLVLLVGRKSYVPWADCMVDRDLLHDKRKLSGPLDELLLHLLKAKREEDPSFIPEQEFEELNKQRREMDHACRWKTCMPVHDAPDGRPVGAKDAYFLKAYELMWSYIKGLTVVDKYHDLLKSNIRNAHDSIKVEIENSNEKAAFDIYGGYNHRAIDPLLDALVIELAKVVREEHSGYDFKLALGAIEYWNTFLLSRGVHTYLPRTVKLFIRWNSHATPLGKVGMTMLTSVDEHARQFADSIKHEIMTCSRELTEQLENMITGGAEGPDRDILSEKMLEFVPEVERLAKMPDGRSLAFDFAMFLGRHSYTTLPGMGPDYGRCSHSERKSVPGVVGKQHFLRPSDATIDDIFVKLLAAGEGAFVGQQKLLSMEAQMKTQRVSGGVWNHGLHEEVLWRVVSLGTRCIIGMLNANIRSILNDKRKANFSEMDY